MSIRVGPPPALAAGVAGAVVPPVPAAAEPPAVAEPPGGAADRPPSEQPASPSTSPDSTFTNKNRRMLSVDHQVGGPVALRRPARNPRRGRRRIFSRKMLLAALAPLAVTRLAS